MAKEIEEKSRESLSERAYVEIKRMILDLQLLPGSLISEPELSLKLHHSKASIRVAFARLVQEKLVQSIARQGYVVSPLTVQDARNILDLRILLEPRAAFLAAGLVTAEDFEHVEQGFLKGYQPTDMETIGAYLATNKEFRLIPPRAAKNHRMETMISNLLDELGRYLRLSFVSHPNRSSQIFEGQRELMNALIAGKADEAEQITRKQLERTRQKVLEALLSREEILLQPLELKAR